MGKSSPSDIESRTDNARAPQSFYPPMSKPWFPWLMPTFVIVNVAAFVYTMYINNCPATTGRHRCVFPSLGRFSFQPLSQNPLFGPSTKTLELMGGLEWILVVKEGEGWRLISCIWLHAGVIHLLTNMISLLFIGIRLEQEFGFLKVGLVYVISGFGGSLLSSLTLRSSISVGASGALFGMLGAMLSELITNWTIYANKGFFLVLFFSFVLSLDGLTRSIFPQDMICHIRNQNTNVINIFCGLWPFPF
ncbi:PREDICTED: RHOMBOID-like protein 2 isoform X2 [Nelumbo nucifera]|uniref:RHOMBOID-like protein n=1 Tax=Nelumbo nucifera TaxID=4432 RepID=A0A1U7ZND2_NELNU|nr:PREDICTED: RHOMBOID-like protein 2 isoform X2 [Nelumbo nucifera]